MKEGTYKLITGSLVVLLIMSIIYGLSERSLTKRQEEELIKKVHIQDSLDISKQEIKKLREQLMEVNPRILSQEAKLDSSINNLKTLNKTYEANSTHIKSLAPDSQSLLLSRNLQEADGLLTKVRSSEFLPFK